MKVLYIDILSELDCFKVCNYCDKINSSSRDVCMECSSKDFNNSINILESRVYDEMRKVIYNKFNDVGHTSLIDVLTEEIEVI